MMRNENELWLCDIEQKMIRPSSVPTMNSLFDIETIDDRTASSSGSLSDLILKLKV